MKGYALDNVVHTPAAPDVHRKDPIHGIIHHEPRLTKMPCFKSTLQRWQKTRRSLESSFAPDVSSSPSVRLLSLGVTIKAVLREGRAFQSLALRTGSSTSNNLGEFNP